MLDLTTYGRIQRRSGDDKEDGERWGGRGSAVELHKTIEQV